jgi:predicted lipid-binding transport protein (Tim44 family)
MRLGLQEIDSLFLPRIRLHRNPNSAYNRVMQIDLTTVIFAVIAVVLLARLWSVFGSRNEDEPQRPNPFIPQTPPVVTVPPEEAPALPRMPPVLLPPNSVAGGLAQIKTIDPAFDEKKFLQQARQIFTSVVETYASGAMAGIALMLSPQLLAHFQKSVDARIGSGQTAQSRVEAIKDADTVAARAEGSTGFITVKFISMQENILRNAQGNVIGGAVGKTEEVTDIWVFSRDTATADSPWIVVETRG